MATIHEILDKLLTQTQKGKVNWHTTADKQTFLALFGDYSTVISKRQAFSTVAPRFEFKILDQRGDEIDGMTMEMGGLADATRARLSKLHEAARRKAIGIETHLDNLSKAIDAAGVNSP